MPSAVSRSSFLRAAVSLGCHNEHEPGNVRTLPELVEFNATHNPDSIFCLQANQNDETTRISFIQLKYAVLSCSAWLKTHLSNFKPPSPDEDGRVARGPPVALFMESDIGIFIYLISLLSIGTPVLLLSARLSPLAINTLLDETGTSFVLSSARLFRTINEAFLLAKSTQSHIPSISIATPYQTFLAARTTHSVSDATENICNPYHYTYKKDCNVLILHSSGTTGLPKALSHAHELLMRFVGSHELEPGIESQGINASTLPLYHGFGLVAPILSLSIGLTVYIPQSSSLPTGPSIIEALQASTASSLMTVPSILEDICSMPHDEGIDALRSLQFVAFGGGAVKETVGDRLVYAGVKLVNTFGTTETGPLAPVFVPTLDYNWRYFRLRKDLDIQLQSLPHLEREVQKLKLTMYLPECDRHFELPDLLVPNSESSEREYAPVGRNDDLIVLATGEKVLPHILEDLLTKSPLVKTAVAFGEGHFEIGVIIEPSTDIHLDQYDQYKSSVWPIIVQAAERMDAHARIASKSNIIILPAGQALPRTDKGSVARKDVYRIFESEITKAYEELENDMSEDSLPKLDPDRLDCDLKDLVQSRLNWKVPPKEWTCDDDFFVLGMDSLQAVRLRRLLITSLPDIGSTSEWIGRDFVYQNPTINRIVTVFNNRYNQGSLVTDAQSEIDKLVETYAFEPQHGGMVILLTGSTGSLGSHLLAHWAGLQDIDEIICLNRTKIGIQTDAKERQMQIFHERRIHMPEHAWSKIRFIQSDAAFPCLGLTEHEYKDLCGRITHIFHNAWPMDFNWKLPSFKAQFQTVYNLLNLARGSHKTRPMAKTRFVMVSSIAVVGQYGVVHGGCIVPEIPIYDTTCTTLTGYGSAKMVCERIVENFAKAFKHEIEASFVRVGQMSGSEASGYWNTAEHIPALIKSSQRIGKLPRLEGTFSWIPVDITARVLSEILLTAENINLVLHLENPVRQSWHDALTILSRELKLSITSAVPLQQWLSEVLEAGEGFPGENPVTKLSQFFDVEFERMSSGKVIMATDCARALSPTLRNIEEVPIHTIVRYIQYWKNIEFLK